MALGRGGSKLYAVERWGFGLKLRKGGECGTFRRERLVGQVGLEEASHVDAYNRQQGRDLQAQ